MSENKLTKTVLCAAMFAALGSVSMGAHAVKVVNMTIEEVGVLWGGGTADNGGTNLDGGIFYFAQGLAEPLPDGWSNQGSASFVSATGTDGAILNNVQQGPGAFTGGFDFSGADFLPNSCGASANVSGCTAAPTGTEFDADHDGTGDGLTINLSDYGGFFDALGGVQFPLFPDGGAGTNGHPLRVASTALGAAGAIVPLAPNQFYYSLDWTHLITTEENPFFAGNVADWHLEGIGTVVPIPAAVWLFGSGLVGLAAVARRKKAPAGEELTA